MVVVFYTIASAEQSLTERSQSRIGPPLSFMLLQLSHGLKCQAGLLLKFTFEQNDHFLLHDSLLSPQLRPVEKNFFNVGQLY